ncbi:DUF6233 domain-containing protein [Streptomyces xanthochromogenes]|uniref:DUF6233 domain-containing protein n=1 Tax=Streptomyces xanthochromogenes TaxID=67384 RepID=UPI00342BFF82
MYDPIPSELSRLTKLRVVEEHQAYQLERTREAIRRLEVEVERERERQAKARMRVSWKLQPSRVDGGAALLHRADCGLYTREMGYLNAMEAQIAMEEPGIEPCEVCRPQE